MMNVAVNKKKGKLSGAFEINAWSDEPALPDISPADAGKFLGINAQGEIEAETIPVPESKKYYRHVISSTSNYYPSVEIINDDATPFTEASLHDFLTAVGAAQNRPYPTGIKLDGDTNKVKVFTGIYPHSTNSVRLVYREITITNGNIVLGAMDYVSYSVVASWDNVSEI